MSTSAFGLKNPANNHLAGELLIMAVFENWFASKISGNCEYIPQPAIA